MTNTNEELKMKKTSQEIAKALREANEAKWARRKARWNAWKNEQSKAK